MLLLSASVLQTPACGATPANDPETVTHNTVTAQDMLQSLLSPPDASTYRTDTAD
jgi:hypothetical protein